MIRNTKYTNNITHNDETRIVFKKERERLLSYNSNYTLEDMLMTDGILNEAERCLL